MTMTREVALGAPGYASLVKQLYYGSSEMNLGVGMIWHSIQKIATLLKVPVAAVRAALERQTEAEKERLMRVRKRNKVILTA